MCQWRTFVHLIRTAPKSDIIVLFATFILTILFDLVVAIEIGMVLACLLFIKRMSEETHVDGWTYVDDDTPDVDAHLKKLPLQIRVYEITGPLFFGAADAIEHIVVKDFTTCLVLRMRSVPAIDSTAVSYTHLDVYKRQVPQLPGHNRTFPLQSASCGIVFCGSLRRILRQSSPVRTFHLPGPLITSYLH